MSRHRVSFRVRAVPLVPAAALVQGDDVASLVARLLDRAPAELARLEGVRGRDVMVVTGPSELLPWCAGVRYFGAEPGAPQLLLPLDLEPDVPAAWLHAALPGEGVRLIVPRADGLTIVPLAAARPIDRALLVGAP
jgi:hypothetical protein